MLSSSAIVSLDYDAQARRIKNNKRNRRLACRRFIALHYWTLLGEFIVLSGAMASVPMLLSMPGPRTVPDVALFELDTGSPQCVIPDVAAPCAFPPPVPPCPLPPPCAKLDHEIHSEAAETPATTTLSMTFFMDILRRARVRNCVASELYTWLTERRMQRGNSGPFLFPDWLDKR